VQNLLASHDMDPRYQSREAKARIATLYVPLIGIVIDALPQLCIDTRPAQQHESTEVVNADDARGIDQTVAMAIAGSSVYTIASESSATVMFHDTDLSSCLSSTASVNYGVTRFFFIFLYHCLCSTLVVRNFQLFCLFSCIMHISPRVGPGQFPLCPLSLYFPTSLPSMVFLVSFTFLFSHSYSLHLFSCFHPFTFYQNSLTPFPGRML